MEQGPTMANKQSSWPWMMALASSRARKTKSVISAVVGSSSNNNAGKMSARCSRIRKLLVCFMAITRAACYSFNVNLIRMVFLDEYDRSSALGAKVSRESVCIVNSVTHMVIFYTISAFLSS